MMGKKFYTIIVVPHAKAKFRKVRVPYSLFMLAGVGAAVAERAGGVCGRGAGDGGRAQRGGVRGRDCLIAGEDWQRAK